MRPLTGIASDLGHHLSIRRYVPGERQTMDIQKIARGGLAAFALIGSLMAGGPSSAQVTLNVNSVAAQNLLGSDHLAADYIDLLSGR